MLEFSELLDSSSIDAKGWAEIAWTIYRNYTLFDAFVVLHGTDSLAYTCSALSFMLQNLGKPVVFTGSQIPMSERKNDAIENLIDALDIAGHFNLAEVVLCFNSKVFRGNRCTKISANAFDAFASPNMLPLATITAMDTVVAWDLAVRPKSLEAFSIQTNLETHHVACLRMFPGIKPEMVDAVLHTQGLRGLVLETFGAGNAPSGVDNAMTRVISSAIARGIVIVNVSQCLSGSVEAIYAPGQVLGRAGVVPGGDMTTEAALTKLAYLLALPSSTPESVCRDMSVSLRGEITSRSKTTFTRPSSPARSENLPSTPPSPSQLSLHLSNFTALAYAIASGSLSRVKSLLQVSQSHDSDGSFILNKQDYSGNTALHLAATGSNIEILKHFLMEGASVHIRNYTGNGGRTPLFMAANAGLKEHVELLRRSGAHLHSGEMEVAKLHATKEGQEHIWNLAGVVEDR